MRPQWSAVALLVVIALVAGCGDRGVEGTSLSPAGTLPPGVVPGRLGVGVPGTAETLPPRPFPIIAAGGDVSCAPEARAWLQQSPDPKRCQDRATFDQLLAIEPDSVLALGDLQYEDGSLASYQTSYDPSWGTLKARTRPVPGNHEHATAGAAGYFDYFGGIAGPYGKGWYSFDLGSWHLIALNSNCASAGGCGADSEQLRWLTDDLNGHRGAKCTLAFWHHPRYSSGALHGDDADVAPLWDALQVGGADVVLSGHEHNYERFERMGTSGKPDRNGMVEFVVGTGGKSLYDFAKEPKAGSAARNASAFGVLQLGLRDGGYDFEFKAVAGATFVDAGKGDCR